MKTAEDIFASDSIAPRWTLDPIGNQTAVDYFRSYHSNSFQWVNWGQNWVCCQ